MTTCVYKELTETTENSNQCCENKCEVKPKHSHHRKAIGLTDEEKKKSGLFLNEHLLKECYSITEYCQVCGQICIGTCLRCSQCNMIVHEECASTFYAKCSGHSNKLDFPKPTFSRKDLKNGQHSFRQMDNMFFVQCVVCREMIFVDRCKCSICGMNVHKKCVENIKVPCRPIASPNDKKDYHWLVETAVSRNRCLVCDDSCQSLHYRCAWCKVEVDSPCIDKMPTTCCYGKLSKYILPPRLVREKDDWYEAIYDHHKEPMVFFINNKSGGHAGKSIFQIAMSIFNPAQVYNVLKGYERPFNFIKNYGDNFIAVICGGDGTVGILMNEFKRLGMKPKIFVIPLGTGNDMSISTGWGCGYDGENLVQLLSQVRDASVQDMDRWQICVNGKEEPIHTFNNYFSLGIDASISLTFDQRRKESPDWFDSRFMNKMQYVFSLAPTIAADNPIKNIKLKVDGHDIEVPPVEGIAVINLPTYGGGNRVWSSCSESEMAFGFHDLHYNDGEIEIIGFTSIIHLLACVSGTGIAEPIKIAQGKVVEITLDQDTPAQFDGEPYMQTPTTIKISLFEKVRFIVKNMYDVNA